MQNLTLKTTTITEGKAMHLIFNACRANETRRRWFDGEFCVCFQADGDEHIATLYRDTMRVATAIVDRFDC